MDAALLDMRKALKTRTQRPPGPEATQAGAVGLRRLPLPPGADKGGGRELGWHGHRGPAALLPPALGTWGPVPPWLACISVGLCLETLMVHRAGHSLRKSQTQNGKIRTQEQYSQGQEDKAETSTGTGAKTLWLPSDQSKKGRAAGCRASLPEAAANANRWACTGQRACGQRGGTNNASEICPALPEGLL